MNFKNLAIATLVLAVGAIFTSCKKCKDCSAVVIQEYDPAFGLDNDTTTATFGETCGDDLKEIDGKTTTINQSSMGMQFKQTTTYTCL